MKALCVIIFFLSAGFLSAKPLDSLRVETSKGVKFILHKVDKEESLAAISKRYKVSSVDVVKLNEIKNNKISKGQVLKIPYVLPDSVRTPQADSNRVDEAHANAQSQEVQKVYTHMVSNGETINSISKKYKITAAQLTKWNSLKSTKLIVDENVVAKPYVRMNGTEAQLPLAPQNVEFARADIIEQTGLAAIDETMQVAHADAPVGTIIKVINLDNNLQCLVKVTDKIDTTKFENFIITFGKEARQKLKADGATIRVKIVYAVKP
ncbi:MAG: LysM peptidoglycan-binding domain-containing protein [Bacteroidota bacterium]